jgi:hypothetical protein
MLVGLFAVTAYVIAPWFRRVPCRCTCAASPHIVGSSYLNIHSAVFYSTCESPYGTLPHTAASAITIGFDDIMIAAPFAIQRIRSRDMKTVLLTRLPKHRLA